MAEDFIKRGEAHPKAKLTDHDCKTIRLLYGDGSSISLKQIATKFDCSKSTVAAIVNKTRRAKS